MPGGGSGEVGESLEMSNNELNVAGEESREVHPPRRVDTEMGIKPQTLGRVGHTFGQGPQKRATFPPP